MLSEKAKAWLRTNRALLEQQAAEWADAGSRAGGQYVGEYPTRPLEEMLLTELIECMGPKLARVFVEGLTPDGGWPEEAA